eukprot:c16117_g1_i1 orf=3-263(-)
MGCFHSKLEPMEGSEAQPHELNSSMEALVVPTFREFCYDLLRVATNGFSNENIVSVHSNKAPDIVYKGRLENGYWIALKSFPKSAWP